MANASFTLAGDKALQRQLKAMSSAMRGQTLKRALIAGALLIVNDAKARAPYDTGNLRRSLHVGGEGGSGGLEADTTGKDIGGQQVGRDYVEVSVGTNVEYARRREFGFAGTDSLGRTYNDPATPYLRPAVESQRDAVQQEIVDAARDLIRAAL